jgi:mannosyltransferase OCH1-like enzyme
VEKWLRVVEEEDIPYLFWDDAGVAQFMRTFEPNLEAEFYGLPSPVERSDVFRVLVCKWIGGVVSPPALFAFLSDLLTSCA